eukprot:6118860-Prymnesium_polylepis.2
MLGYLWSDDPRDVRVALVELKSPGPVRYQCEPRCRLLGSPPTARARARVFWAAGGEIYT